VINLSGLLEVKKAAEKLIIKLYLLAFQRIQRRAGGGGGGGGRCGRCGYSRPNFFLGGLGRMRVIKIVMLCRRYLERCGGEGGIALTVYGIDKTSRVFRPSFYLAESFYKRSIR